MLRKEIMSDKIVTLTDANFESEVLKSETPVLVDFWAVWCGPCKMIAPELEKIADEKPADVLKIGKLNVDENRDTAIKYGISSIPTLLLFKNGEVAKKLSERWEKTDYLVRSGISYNKCPKYIWALQGIVMPTGTAYSTLKALKRQNSSNSTADILIP